MKSIARNFLTVLIFSFHLSMFGQFNTLTPLLPKKTDNTTTDRYRREIGESKQKSGKKIWKDIFHSNSRSELKKELDSLKAIIKENSEVNRNKWNMQKIKDSLILQLQSQTVNNEQKRSLSITKKAFENGSKELAFSKIAMPLSRGISVTSPYGDRVHPIFRTSRMHNGIDLKAHYENVYAVMDGTVTETGWDSKGGGNFIKVKHYERFETAYLHLSEIYYRAGEFVKAGYIIAKSGNSGNSTGAHLHFSVRENGKYINPAHFLNNLIKADQLLAASYQN
ncbi:MULTISPECIES: M23 family metallopeptidase [Chryseobacterium]|uniref:Peptidase family M23 n=1 Tax=Chryseobacterium profundimaris TaxID=1387275 RepID=A0ABY1NZP4_9FLAO|nr:MULTISPECIES: M23 family metallopeptidase [Chryseobacterium]PZU89026.1 MAG: M23 family peptidase [Chryseobacterium sp.]SMP22466.1 Peptidase family M23 [Chryseobacterium profundimaris]